ncbi:hypothetical protein [Mesorhizobium wenxiniae]|uniref:hypothetical protein n=1 Tax=Mesorhizobium wenxiniae TaxID=2014805 RepID=UPI0013FD713B|nr:hypothetical protein [Mesorhizobium wenxiniae]
MARLEFHSGNAGIAQWLLLQAAGKDVTSPKKPTALGNTMREFKALERAFVRPIGRTSL